MTIAARGGAAIAVELKMSEVFTIDSNPKTPNIGKRLGRLSLKAGRQ
jgi:hypothetical protein